MSQLLVFGNEKGGAGKSTLSMHVACALLQSGASVGVLDLDLRQLTLRRFFENRANYAALHSPELPSANVGQVDPKAEDGEDADFARVTSQLLVENDFVVVDCPGALTKYSELAHANADKLITPMNDSFIDFDLLARIDPETNAVKGPSIYSEMVWDARKARSLSGGKPIDWIVARNRLSSTNMHNKRKVGEALANLSKRIGFRLVPGLSDRVIFKELFPKGLTVADPSSLTQLPSSLSNIAARQELRDLMNELDLPDFKVGF
jgi:chromosome partitioning protein